MDVLSTKPHPQRSMLKGVAPRTTSDIGTTSLQWTLSLPPMCPLLGGFTVITVGEEDVFLFMFLTRTWFYPKILRGDKFPNFLSISCNLYLSKVQSRKKMAAVCECWVVCLFGRGTPSSCHLSSQCRADQTSHVTYCLREHQQRLKKVR